MTTRAPIDLRPSESSSYHGKFARMKAAAYAMILVTCLYLCTIYIAIGWVTYMLTIIPLGVIILSAVARINDLGVEMISARWNVRRIGLILTAVYGLTQLLAPVFFGAIEDWPTWRTVIGTWGFALVWLTSEHLPPWNMYIWKGLGDYSPPFPRPRRRKSDDFDSNP